MAKYLLLILVIMVVLWALSSRSAQRGQPGNAGSGARRGRGADGGGPEEMVRCAHCGVHLPRREALALEAPRSAGDIEHYCCPEHRQRGPAAHPRA